MKQNEVRKLILEHKLSFVALIEFASAADSKENQRAGDVERQASLSLK